MEEALDMAHAKDTKERMAGVEHLHQYLETSSKSLSSSEVTSLVDVCLDLLKENNFRVCQGALQSLASAAVLSGEHLKLHLNSLVPAIVERLGDAKQPVRDAARRLLITLMEISSPTIIVERAGSYAWMHKSWRVREEFARTVTSATSLFASTELPFQRAIFPPILQMLSDINHGVREAAISCIEEMYLQCGPQFHDELQRHQVPPSLIKDINTRLQRIEPKLRPLELAMVNLGSNDAKAVISNPKKCSPRAKCSNREVSIFGGETDATEKPVERVKVYSEKELIKEFEKIVTTLVPEKDWSLRIAAMQRVEGLVSGGAAEYPCFHGLLKQLVNSLITQLSDRRSSIVKQACHLLSLLSKELLGDFESCVEILIPVLFKLVIITVLVIAESADSCIKTMLRNCKVPRALPRIAECAKNDRSSILRARCCEYSLLILEYWADAPEIQKSADLYEDLIKCCVGDAMSEVRSTARTCYRMFARTWPDRSRRLFLSFDAVIQRVMNDEDGGMHKRYASPSLRERGGQVPLSVPQTRLPSTFSTPEIIAADRTVSLPILSESTDRCGRGRSIESVLNSSKEKVTAIESMLRGSDKRNISSLDLGVDPPSSRDPPLPLAAPASGLVSSRGGTPWLPSEMMVTPRMLSSRREYEREQLDSCIPNFQRPLLRKNVPGRVLAGRRKSLDDTQFGELVTYADRPLSLGDALTEGLSPSSDWSVRVSAFGYVRSLLQHGPKGIAEVCLCFDKVMKLFFQHLEDPHHKVAQAALLALSDLILCCRKPFEGYMERMLPSVFSRLIDSKESVRIPCSDALDSLTRTYGIESLLPSFLRSLDEQRSPKAKLAVIEFATSSFMKNAAGGGPDGCGSSGILKLWLAKLAPLVLDRNVKLREAAVACVISIYTHFDSSSVLSFILGLSVEEQNAVRRVLKQYTPRIEVDLVSFLQQSRKERPVVVRPRSFDPSDVADTSSEEGAYLSRFSGWKWRPPSSESMLTGSGSVNDRGEPLDVRLNKGMEAAAAAAAAGLETGPSIAQILHIMCDGLDRGSAENDKHSSIQHLIDASIANDQSVWPNYFNQILTAVLEVVEDPDPTVRELALSLIAEMLKNQKDAMDDSVEIIAEKLLHVARDDVCKISAEAERCLAALLSRYDAFQCLSVITPLLVNGDDKTLVTCINCLTKLVSRLSRDELVGQLPTFLPALFDAFGSPNADVRKTVVFCLVDIYIMLGKEFLPYLEGLNSTQLRLVTLYANRISQARNGPPLTATP